MSISGAFDHDAWMGPLPRAKRCTCHICRPERHYAREDRRIIDDVLRHGWQVLLIGTGGCDHPDHDHGDPGDTGDGDEPAFAHTLGLGHRAGHPELLVSGLHPGLMHRCLDRLARQVLDGRRFRAGDVLEGVLGGVPVVLEDVSDVGREEAVPWSGWFHRRRPEALVVVWPTANGLFSWQPGAPAVLDEAQPPRWRRPMVHTGGVAADPAWLLPVPPDRLAFSCTHVLDERRDVLWAARQRGGTGDEDWTAHCGAAHTVAEMRLVHLAHLVRGAPSLRQLADLPLDHEAERSDVDAAWRVSRISPVDEAG